MPSDIRPIAAMGALPPREPMSFRRRGRQTGIGHHITTTRSQQRDQQLGE
jgi:hypothetical protein